MRRLCMSVTAAMLACTVLWAQTTTSVPGMSRFTDAGFGFSFCYPTAWKVTEGPVVDATRGGWFPDAKIVKMLVVRNPAAADNDEELPGVSIEELLALRGLTELGSTHSPSPVGVDEKFFFDSKKQQWMFENLTEEPNGTPAGTIILAEIKQRTMGGLPMFYGAVRGGAESIVPLDATHFLAIMSLVDPLNDQSHTHLATTVMATNLRAGHVASEQTQVAVIHRAGIKLGAIGKALGSWYKDAQHVYNQQGDVMPGADPQTFTPLPAEGPTGAFARDRTHVYDQWGAVVPGADPKTFAATGMSTARDAHHTYDWTSGTLKIGTVF